MDGIQDGVCLRCGKPLRFLVGRADVHRPACPPEPIEAAAATPIDIEQARRELEALMVRVEEEAPEINERLVPADRGK